MKEIKPIKIAILSCNHGHAKAYYCLKNDPLFELVGCSVEPDYRDKIFIERLDGVPLYDTDEELYENHPEIEAVIIASANIKHMEQFRVAAKKGLHIFSMKIPTFDLEEYSEMERLAEENGIVCQVELEMREHPELYRVKELIESGALGEILSINMMNYSHNPVWWRPWQCDPEESYGKKIPLYEGGELYRGGALADHPHVFDCIRFLTGSSFDTVYAEVAPNLREGVQTEDMIRVMGRLKSGAIFSIDPSYANDEMHVEKMTDWQKYPRCVEVTMNIVGTKGTLLADLYGKPFNRQSKSGNGYYLSGAPGSVGLWDKRMQDFYDCIRGGEKPPVDLKAHRESIEAMLAAYESVSTGKIIKMK